MVGNELENINGKERNTGKQMNLVLILATIIYFLYANAFKI